jgi:mono/diheme cytochrome c family protein
MAGKARKVALGVVVLLALLVVVVISKIGWQVVLGPKARPVTARKFDATDARLARGKYLAEGPAHCFFCHTEHDLTQPQAPIVQARKGAGWAMPAAELNNISSANITSDRDTGLGAWTDDEIARAIQEGISRDGHALFPLMPYLGFANLDEEDIASIVVYLRTIPPVRNQVAKRNLPFPLEFIVKTIPTPKTMANTPHPTSTPVERGKYLVHTVAGCPGCHTPADQGNPLPGLAFGGGERFEIPMPNGETKTFFSANITRDPSGIRHYDEAMFIETLHTGQIKGRALSFVMPFEFFKNLSDDDLRDIFAYLGTVTPVKHRVSNSDPPTPCPLCKRTHGLGNLNTAPTK